MIVINGIEVKPRKITLGALRRLEQSGYSMQESGAGQLIALIYASVSHDSRITINDVEALTVEEAVAIQEGILHDLAADFGGAESTSGK